MSTQARHLTVVTFNHGIPGRCRGAVSRVLTGARRDFSIKFHPEESPAPQTAWQALTPLVVRAWKALHTVVTVAIIFEAGKPWNPLMLLVIVVGIACLFGYLVGVYPKYHTIQDRHDPPLE